jgi:hypothetical protein
MDEHTGRIVIDGQTFAMQQSGPLALEPQVGHKVTLFYEERERPKRRHANRAGCEAGQLR